MAGRRESPLDPSAGPVARFAAELRKLRAEAESPTYRVMAQRTGQGASTLSQAAGGERMPTLPVVLAYVHACGGDAVEWEERWHQATAEKEAEPRTEDGDAEPPYRGLARFEPADADLFFGRDQLTDHLFELTSSRRFTAVFGPSGSGKSSLLRAGLIPRLRNPDTAGPRAAALRVLTPGEHPVRTHAQRLIPKDAEGDTWLLVDQFEELYTLCHDPAERGRFIDQLLACTDPASRLRVVIAVRADFLGHCAQNPRLTAALQDVTVLAGPMTREELREAIVKPAQTAGLIVERALTARLLDEGEGEPGALPLMSHALLETWRRRQGRALTLEAYEAAGGLRGAIARTAEDAYARFTPAQSRLARQILLRLITPGEGTPDTRRPAAREELDFGVYADADAVLEQLTGARLLTLDQGTVDLAHEALITGWPRLRRWIDADRERLRIHRQLTEAAEAWKALDCDPGALYRGVRLAAAEEAFASPESDDLTVVERDFLTASTAARAEERRTAARAARRQRAFLVSLSMLTVVALVVGVIAWQQNAESDHQRVQAAARRAATVAEGLRSSDPRTAMRLSVAAWHLSHTPETRSVLLGALAQDERDSLTLPSEEDAQSVLSRDGRTLMLIGNTTVTEWDLRKRRVIARHRIPAYDDANLTMEYTPDGQFLMLPTGHGQQVRLWNVRTERYQGPAFGPSSKTDEPPSAVFSEDGKTIQFDLGSHSEEWDPWHRKRLYSLPAAVTERIDGGADTPDGHLLALCVKGRLELWNIRHGQREDRGWHHTVPCPSDSDMQFTPDGTVLTMSDELGLRQVQISDGKELRRLYQASPQEYTFTPDGKFLASLGVDEVLLWRLDHRQAPVFSYPLADDHVSQLRIDVRANLIRYMVERAEGKDILRVLDLGRSLDTAWRGPTAKLAVFSADSSTLAVVRRHGRVSRFVLLDGHNGKTTANVAEVQMTGTDDDPDEYVSLSSDGRRLAYSPVHAVDLNHPVGVRVWDVKKRTPITEITPSEKDAIFGGATFTPDGQELITATPSDAPMTVWNARTGKRIRQLRDGKRTLGGFDLAAIRRDGRMMLTNDGELISSSGRKQHTALRDCPLCGFAFSPDGRRIVVRDTEEHVSLWDGKLRNLLGVLSSRPLSKANQGQGEPEEITSFTFSPDGSTLAVADSNGALRLWDVASQQPLGTALPTPGDRIQSLAFSKDGGTLYASGEHVQWQAYDVDPTHATATICRRTGGPLSRADWHRYLADVPYETVC